MSRIDEIKERLELRSGSHWEMKSDIKYLLAKLERAEDALIHLDRVISFKKMGKLFDLPTDIKTGTELMMWEERNNHILALNNAKKFAAETLEKLKD